MTIEELIHNLTEIASECQDGMETNVHLYSSPQIHPMPKIRVEKYALSGGLAPIIIIHDD